MKPKHLLFALLAQLMISMAAAGGELVVRSAWIRTAPPNAPVLAGYMTIENRADRSASLVAAASPAFTDVTIHRTELVDDVTRMINVRQLDVAAHGTLVLKPGGYHLMLAQPKRPLRAGDRVPVYLRFADGSRLSALFAVRDDMAAREDGPAHADHPVAHRRAPR